MLQKIKNSKYTPYVIIAVLGILICIPYFTQDLIDNNEFRLHVIRINAVKELIGDGVFPPLISYKYMLGFGYGINIFYGVICTYIPILISCISGSISQSIKIFAMISVILSGITMYLFVLKVTKSKRIAVLASIIYMLMPYKLSNIYIRHAIGEYTAFIFIPTFFEGLYCALRSDKKALLLLTIGACGLILSHTISMIYSAIFGTIYVLINYKDIRNSFFWKTVVKAIALTLLLTSFYTIPIIEHKIAGDYVIFNDSIMRTSGDAVSNNTNKIGDWLKLNLTYNDEVNFSLGIPTLILIVMTAFTFKKINNNYKKIYWIFLSISILSLFMCTSLFPWKIMPQFLTIIQFAWRLNGFFIFFIAMICGINAYNLSTFFKKKETIIFMMILMICSWIPIASVIGQIKHDGTEKETKYEESLHKDNIFGVYSVVRDYMPVKAYAIKDKLDKKENKAIVKSGNTTVVSEDKNKLSDRLQIETTNESEIELPYLYYLGYTTKINGKKINNYESQNGFITVKVNESGVLEIKYEGTTLEKIAYIVSTSCLVIVVTYIAINSRRKEHI